MSSKTVENGKSQKETKNPDGTITLPNPHLAEMESDFLYHLSLGTATDDLVARFGDVKFVCMGGTKKRMLNFANYIMKEIGYELPEGESLVDISAPADRYSMYKVGPVLSVSHGMGFSSISILLHELLKLMQYAKAKDPVFFRIGTCGGLAVEPGTVVVSTGAVDPMLNHSYEWPVLGKRVKRPAILDQDLAKELVGLADPSDPFQTVPGITMGTEDFYEGQGRLDGAFCDYAQEDKMNFLRKLNNYGVINIEMECIVLAALTHQAGVKAAIVCVTFLDRFNGDQVTPPKETLDEWQLRPQTLVGRYIKRHLKAIGH